MLHNSFLASRDFCHLQLTFANSLEPDQNRQNDGSDLDPNCFDTLIRVPERVNFTKIIRSQQSMKNFRTFKEINKVISISYDILHIIPADEITMAQSLTVFQPV